MGKVTHSRIKYGTELKCRKSKPQYSDTLLGLSIREGTYVQLSSIQQGLKSAGVNSSWNGSDFDITSPSQTSTSTGSTRTSTGTSTSSETTQQLASDLQNLYPSITIDAYTFHFTYIPVSNGVGALINSADYPNWLELCMSDANNNDFSDIKNALQPIAQYAYDHGNIIVAGFYAGEYSSYPSGYQPYEVSLAPDGNYQVLHAIWGVDNGSAHVYDGSQDLISKVAEKQLLSNIK